MSFHKFPALSQKFLKSEKIDETSRYVYFARDTLYTGTLFANIQNDSLLDAKFIENKTIKEAKESLRIGSMNKVAFWIAFIIFMIYVTRKFYAAENRWLYPALVKKDREAAEEAARLAAEAKPAKKVYRRPGGPKKGKKRK